MQSHPNSFKIDIAIKSLEGNSTYLLAMSGHSVLALRLPGKTTREISGQELAAQGFVSRLKAKLGLINDEWRWLTVTSVDNPLLEDTNRFAELIADELTKATGITITKSDLALSASVPINGAEIRENSAR